MQRLCVWLWMAALAALPLSAQSTPHDQASKLKAGSKVEVTLTTGETVQGRLGTVSDETLTLLDARVPTLPARVLRWDEVERVKSREAGLARKIVVRSAIAFGILIAITMVAMATG